MSIWTPETHGHGKIELFDARSLRKLEEIGFTNFIALAGKRHNQWRVREDYQMPWYRVATQPSQYWPERYANFTSNFNSIFADYEPVFPFTHIALTDDGAAETPLTEDRLRGNTIGYANKQTFSGADSLRGNLNVAESVHTPGLTRWVFDWPTSAANGTFQSICWAQLYEAAIWGQVFSVDTTVGWFNDSVLSNGAWYGAWDPVGRYVYASGFDGAGYVARSPWNAGNTMTMETPARFYTNDINVAMTIVGNEIFIVRNAQNNIAVYPLATNTIAAVSTPSRTLSIAPYYTAGNQSAWLTTDGTYLYLLAKLTPGNFTVTKMSVTGTVAGSFTVPLDSTYNPTGIVYDPDHDEIVIAYSVGAFLRSYGASGSSFGVFKARWAGPQNGLSGNGLVIDGRLYLINTSRTLRRLSMTSALGTRARLSAPTTKSNTQTMKITYEFDYS